MNTRILISLLFTCLCLIWIGCEDDKEIFFDELKVEEEELDAVHANMRDKPYPREGQLLYINPCPLIVPRELRPSGGFLEFELSQDMNFPEEGTFRSGKKSWNMYNVHKELAVGDWYWRYRSIDNADKVTSWSETIKFTITGDEEKFVTPEWSVFKERIPQGYPRTQCFLDDYLPVDVAKAKTHPEYGEVEKKANEAMKYQMPGGNPYASSPTGHVKNLMNAYVLLQEEKYQDKMLEIARNLIAYPVSDKELLNGGNFSGSDRADMMSILYDYCYEKLDESEKSAIEDVLVRLTGYYFDNYKGYLENRIFDNHVWQVVLQRITQGAFTICQKYPEVMKNLEYAYEVWTARAPNTGFNRDGAWINGGGYFGVNVYTLFYMPMLFSYVTDFDFLQHPWYKNAGKALVYAWLPGTNETSFGDQVGEYGYAENGKAQMEFADFLARELKDPYASWYVNSETLRHRNATKMRLYRIVKADVAYGEKLGEFENYVWHQDIGSGIAFSDMLHPEKNMALAFRSSPFGSGSHTLADQNSFKLLYKGDYVYRNAGYYTSFGDGHTLLQYRHTRGHNTIMINNIGQAFTTQSYGNITRGLNGDNLAYFLGDASNAYHEFSDYWDGNITGNGFAQTPEYGFGENPLNKYKRHIFMLRPNKVVIYDDLGADEPATWQWLLHSDKEFQIAGNKVTTHYSSSNRGDFVSVAQIFSNHTPIITKTNEWFMNIEPVEDGHGYPKQWHLTANFEATATNRILTVIQLNDQGESEENVWRANNNFVIGDWSIEAEMDGNKPAAISITNETIGTVFSYGNQAPVIEGAAYQRKQENSSVLYDQVKGVMRIQEISDRPLYVTRTVK